MECLLSLLKDFGFVRTNLPLSKPLVIHGVPGCGKTSLLVKFKNLIPNSRIITFGAESLEGLGGVVIEKVPADSYSEGFSEEHFLDEYLCSNKVHSSCLAVFADPYQYRRTCLDAHYTNSKTKRFGKETCILLSNLGFDVTSSKEDKVSKFDIFSAEPAGVIIAFESDVQALLRDHCLDFKTPCEVLGKTFKEVTFVCSDLKEIASKKELRHLTYIGLTRHSEKLNILSADAFD